jgi:signal peptidase I
VEAMAIGARRDVNTGVLRYSKRRSLPWWWQLLVALLVVGLVQAIAVKVYAVPSGSMERTLAVGDRVLADRIAYAVGDPQRGDVVVFRARGAWATQAPHSRGFVRDALVWLGGQFGIGPGTDYTLVKRVIGLPGEKVACCDSKGRVTVDDAPLEEPYVFEDHEFEAGSFDCESAIRSPRCFAPVLVPDGSYLVLGDHRSASADSVVGCRGAPFAEDCARFVDHDDVIGRVFQIVYPLTRWRGI